MPNLLTSELKDSIVKLTQDLVRISSQGGIDASQPILNFVGQWLNERELDCDLISNERNEKVAALIRLQGKDKLPTYCLNACLDTAPFGDLSAWQDSPLSGAIADGWLYGRGSADSKIAVSIFAHIALLLQKHRSKFAANIDFLFDVDEHTGNFGGVKQYIKLESHIREVMIGYPGNTAIHIGARGFYRANITIYGTAAHSGSSQAFSENAIEKAAQLVQKLYGISLPTESNSEFTLPPKLSVTKIAGGSSYSIIPDTCRVFIDIRLTPFFTQNHAAQLIQDLVRDLDLDYPTCQPTSIFAEESWPAYVLDAASKVRTTLLEVAKKYQNHPVKLKIAGPSNIGNYLATKGIGATCGYGVAYRNIHAANECIDLSSIDAVFSTYLETICSLVNIPILSNWLEID